MFRTKTKPLGFERQDAINKLNRYPNSRAEIVAFFTQPSWKSRYLTAYKNVKEESFSQRFPGRRRVFVRFFMMIHPADRQNYEDWIKEKQSVSQTLEGIYLAARSQQQQEDLDWLRNNI